jgi:hypothetical protein
MFKKSYLLHAPCVQEKLLVYAPYVQEKAISGGQHSLGSFLAWSKGYLPKVLLKKTINGFLARQPIFILCFASFLRLNFCFLIFWEKSENRIRLFTPLKKIIVSTDKKGASSLSSRDVEQLILVFVTVIEPCQDRQKSSFFIFINKAYLTRKQFKHLLVA